MYGENVNVGRANWLTLGGAREHQWGVLKGVTLARWFDKREDDKRRRRNTREREEEGVLGVLSLTNFNEPFPFGAHTRGQLEMYINSGTVCFSPYGGPHSLLFNAASSMPIWLPLIFHLLLFSFNATSREKKKRFFWVCVTFPKMWN